MIAFPCFTTRSPPSSSHALQATRKGLKALRRFSEGVGYLKHPPLNNNNNTYNNNSSDLRHIVAEGTGLEPATYQY